MEIPPLNSVVRFAKRRGYVVGYTTFKRHGHGEKAHTYCVIDLDPESAAFLEPLEGEINHDCFISVMLINPSNFDEVIPPAS